MDDLDQRDFSQVPVQALSPEVRLELKRRFREFISAMGGERAEKDAKEEPKPRVQKWDPAVHGRKREA